jgi:predicted site-specific integrase-resolvase
LPDNVHLTTEALAKRLHTSTVTLARWRGQGRGPRFIKAGNRVLYPLDEVAAYEAANARMSTRMLDGEH